MNKEEMLMEVVSSGMLRVDRDGNIWRGLKDAKERRKDGNLIFSMVRGKWVRTMARRLVWRCIHGPIPNGARLGARDGNIWNDHPGNLVILKCSQRRISAFWEKVDRKGLDECWDWTASLNNMGYGQFFMYRDGVRVQPMLAHRFSYELHFRKPLGKLFALHRCDNPKCVNPNHLFPGTQTDNMRDCVNKGRHRSMGRRAK